MWTWFEDSEFDFNLIRCLKNRPGLDSLATNVFFVPFQMCWAVTTGPSSPTDRRPPGRHTPWRWAYLWLCTVTVIYRSINPGVKAIVWSQWPLFSALVSVRGLQHSRHCVTDLLPTVNPVKNIWWLSFEESNAWKRRASCTRKVPANTHIRICCFSSRF